METREQLRTSNGLEGVVVADTRLSSIDGQAGTLVIGGHPVRRVAEAGFEAACGLLWDGELPTPARLAQLRAALGSARVAAHQRASSLAAALSPDDAMDALMAGAAQLPGVDEHPGAAIALTGALPVLVAAWLRARRDEALPAPDPDAAHAADVLRLMVSTGDAAKAAALDRYLCCVCEHGMNASTFTARTVASTGSDTRSAVVAAIAALKGPLHGGAPGPVLDMLDAIGHADAAGDWLRAELEAGRRIMGMGHRVYRARDPRAAVLESAVEGLGTSERVRLARTVEQTAEQLLAERHPGRPLRANVEFYTAVLLEAVGIPREAFSAMFAAARVAGWCAHVAEQRATGRLIRPKARYVGARPAA
jgi:citrate synthase